VKIGPPKNIYLNGDAKDKSENYGTMKFPREKTRQR
jgi:hypothetical protein